MIDEEIAKLTQAPQKNGSLRNKYTEQPPAHFIPKKKIWKQLFFHISKSQWTESTNYWRNNIKTVFRTHLKSTTSSEHSNNTSQMKFLVYMKYPVATATNCIWMGNANRRMTEKRNEHIQWVKKGDKTSALAINNAETRHIISFEYIQTIGMWEPIRFPGWLNSSEYKLVHLQ